jgi:hypothetical protein
MYGESVAPEAQPEQATPIPLLHNAFPLQRGRGISGKIIPNVGKGLSKEVLSTPRRPGLDEVADHLRGLRATGGLPGTAVGSRGQVSWVAVDLDEAEPGPLEAFLEDLWGKGIPAYASTGLTRGFRLYLFFKRPTGQRRAHAIARRLAALAQEAGLGRAEVFPSSPEAGRGKALFLPYFGYLTPSGGNPLLYPDLTPVPLERLPRLKRLDPDRNALSRLRLEGIYRRIAQAPKGERHNTLARLAPLAFTLGPEEKVAEGLRKAAAQAGLPDTDPDEVERVLEWARERAKKGGRREGERRPRLLPPDPKHPLFRGRAGQSRYLALRAIWQVYTAHGWAQDGRPKVQLSYRQIAEGASLSLQTAFKAVKALKEAGVLEGAWSGQAEHGTVWTLDPTAWPGGEEGPEARPLWSPSGLGLTAAQVFRAVNEGVPPRPRDLMEATGRSRDAVRRALKRLTALFGPPEKWNVADLEEAEASARARWNRRRLLFAWERALYRERLGRRGEGGEEREKRPPEPEEGKPARSAQVGGKAATRAPPVHA